MELGTLTDTVFNLRLNDPIQLEIKPHLFRRRGNMDIIYNINWCPNTDAKYIKKEILEQSRALDLTYVKIPSSFGTDILKFYDPDSIYTIGAGMNSVLSLINTPFGPLTYKDLNENIGLNLYIVPHEQLYFDLKQDKVVFDHSKMIKVCINHFMDGNCKFNWFEPSQLKYFFKHKCVSKTKYVLDIKKLGENELPIAIVKVSSNLYKEKVVKLKSLLYSDRRFI